MASSRKWTEDQLRSAVAESASIAQVMRAIGLVPAGGSYRTVTRYIAALNLDTSHFTGQAWIRKHLGPPSAPGRKICGRCRREKSLDDFHRRGGGRHQSVCKICKSDLDRNRKDLCLCGRPKSMNRRQCSACRYENVPDPRYEISDAEVAWVAGILEGEGCWTVSRSTQGRWWVAVRMTDEDVILKLQHLTGVGRISPARGRPQHKMAWAWQVSVQPHREWLTLKVWPWLGVRRRVRIRELWPEVEHASQAFSGDVPAKLVSGVNSPVGLQAPVAQRKSGRLLSERLGYRNSLGARASTSNRQSGLSTAPKAARLRVLSTPASPT